MVQRRTSRLERKNSNFHILKFDYKCVSQRLIYYEPKHKKSNMTKIPLKPKHKITKLQTKKFLFYKSKLI